MTPMKQLSSRRAWFYKRVFPVLWFGVLGVVGTAMLVGGAALRHPEILIGPCVMAVIGFVLMKQMLWDLVDEVLDAGDYLIVRNGGEEDHVALSNIMNVSATTMMNPPRITLRLVTPGKFGPEITFSPVVSFGFSLRRRNAVAEDLIERTYRARTDRKF
jgi:hypothetical protein